MDRFSWKHRWRVIAVVATLVGCGGKAQTSDVVVAPDAVVADVSSDAQGSSSLSTLGLTARVAGASNPTAPACLRLPAIADTVAGLLATIDGESSGFAGAMIPRVTAWGAAFSQFNGLLYGELTQLHPAFLSDSAVSASELMGLLRALVVHVRVAGVLQQDRKALAALLAPLASENATATVRKAAADLVLNLAYLMSNLQLCAPK